MRNPIFDISQTPILQHTFLPHKFRTFRSKLHHRGRSRGDTFISNREQCSTLKLVYMFAIFCQTAASGRLQK